MAGGFDTNGFVLPENNFGGLTNIANELRSENQRKAALAQKQAVQRSVAEKYIGNQFNNKELYTGTAFDPLHNKLGTDLVNQAYQVIEQGGDVADASMAIAPGVKQWLDYADNGKNFQNQLKTYVPLAKQIAGVDQGKLVQTANDLAFPKDKNGNVDVSQYDPNTNYIDEALKKGDVYTNAGINNFVQKSGKTVLNNNDKVVGANGSTVQTKLDMTIPSIMQPERDARGRITGIVPKYQIATDEDQPILHQFGEQVGQPVRLLDENNFNQLINDKDGSGGYILQTVRKLMKDPSISSSDISIGSPQVQHLARAIAYDEINNNSKDFQTIKTASVDKAAPTDKFYAHRAYDIAHGIQPDNSNYNVANLMDGVGQNSDFVRSGAGTIKDGTFYDKNNSPYSGTVNMSKAELPAELPAVLAANKLTLPSRFNVKVEDGVPTEIQTPNGIITRQQMEDFQKQAQIKNKITPQKKFQAAAPSKKDPLGIL